MRQDLYVLVRRFRLYGKCKSSLCLDAGGRAVVWLLICRDQDASPHGKETSLKLYDMSNVLCHQPNALCSMGLLLWFLILTKLDRNLVGVNGLTRGPATPSKHAFHARIPPTHIPRTNPTDYIVIVVLTHKNMLSCCCHAVR